MNAPRLLASTFLFLAAGAVAAPAPPFRERKPEVGAARVVRAMEGYRTRMPPAEGIGEQNGLSVRELEPYIMSHLAGVARRLGAKTRAECAALMPYLKDRDAKLRFIAQQAIEGATKAYPHGLSVECFLDPTSKGHEAMVLHFTELIDRLSP